MVNCLCLGFYRVLSDYIKIMLSRINASKDSAISPFVEFRWCLQISGTAEHRAETFLFTAIAISIIVISPGSAKKLGNSSGLVLVTRPKRPVHTDNRPNNQIWFRAARRGGLIKAARWPARRPSCLIITAKIRSDLLNFSTSVLYLPSSVLCLLPSVICPLPVRTPRSASQRPPEPLAGRYRW